uniref:Uncharacterized protein n=1 Tax=Rhizophora mucronata TaxID=61149 RepID=A0A2P2PDU3_RHIMU
MSSTVLSICKETKTTIRKKSDH